MFRDFSRAGSALLLLASLCQATPSVYGTLVPTDSWDDTRVAPVNSGSDNGLIGNGAWSGFSISWSITQTNGVFHYEYTFSGLSSKAISHVILDLSDNCTSTGSCVYDVDYDVAGTPDLEYGSFGVAPSNPGFPGGASITGVKFDSLPDGLSVISFDSSRAPMWGDFYAKDGVAAGTGDWNYAYNQGLANHSTYNDAKFYVAVPDTVGSDSSVPEPGSWLMMASGGLMLALGVWRRVRS
jgi:hypothetical protein